MHFHIGCCEVQQMDCTHVVFNHKTLDGPYTSTLKCTEMVHLTAYEQLELVRIIKTSGGTSQTLAQFTEAAFDLFEDVSGMEGIPTEDAVEIINSLWSIYCADKTHHP